MRKHVFIFSFFLIDISSLLFSQAVNMANISADFQSDFKYNDISPGDSAVGLHTYFNATYQHNAFEAGLRYEALQKPFEGFLNKEDQGIPHRYVSFQRDRFKVTAGSYYAQFGNGLVLRSYEARGLAFDNALNGIKMDYNIADKIFLTALSGKQRVYFSIGDKDKATVRGGDINVAVSKFFAKDPKLNAHIGGSYVSRYSPGWATTFTDSLPIFVNAYSGRMDLLFSDFSIGGEYAVKTKDPTAVNYYKDTIPSSAIYLTTSYTRTGFGINLQYKEIKDFDFRTEPASTEIIYGINYLPPFSRQSAFKLFSKYPYQTQKSGEKGYQAEINYSPKRGTNFLFNHTELFGLKGEKYYNETSGEAEKKIGSKHTMTVAYTYIESDVYWTLYKFIDSSLVYVHVFALEDVFRINRKHSVRSQVQFLYTEKYAEKGIYQQYAGNLIFGQIDYSMSPHWGLAVVDEYRTGMEQHLATVFLSYLDGNSRFSVSYGKQSAGVSCVGGVCMLVPAFSGFSFSVISKL